jgi:hypothetical protein
MMNVYGILVISTANNENKDFTMYNPDTRYLLVTTENITWK